jgi:hypothetical protein
MQEELQKFFGFTGIALQTLLSRQLSAIHGRVRVRPEIGVSSLILAENRDVCELVGKRKV